MSCKICKNQDLQNLVEQLKDRGESYREILQYLETLGIHISLGTLSNHFFHSTLSRLEIPKIGKDDIILTEKNIGLVDTALVHLISSKVNLKELEALRDSFSKNEESLPKIPTVESYLRHLKTAIEKASIPQETKTLIIPALEQVYNAKLRELGIIPNEEKT